MTDREPGYYADDSGITRWWDGDGWAGAPDARATTDHTQWEESTPSPQALTAAAAQAAAEARARARKDPETMVLQVVLKERLFGTSSANLTELEDVISRQTSRGWRLHTLSTTSSGSHGLGGGDRIQATMVFEKARTDSAEQKLLDRLDALIEILSKRAETIDASVLAYGVLTPRPGPPAASGRRPRR